MKKRLGKAIEHASETRATLVLCVVLGMRVYRDFIRLFRQMLDWLYYHELWIFPPLAFVADYFWLRPIFPPQHPLTTISLLATAFMAMTLTLFLLRPPKRHRAHWISS